MHASRPQDAPFETDLVLIGGGHAHLAVLRAFAMKPEPGVRLTLIAKELEAPYSGMLPGYVAGVYDRAACHIDLAPAAEAVGARLIHGAATGLDLDARRVRLEGRPDLAFDLLSLDIGITPRTAEIEGAAAHGIAVKPVSEFAARWEALRAAAAAADGPRRLAVIGGGAAGFELALAAKRGLEAAAPQQTLQGTPQETFGEERARISVALVSGGALLSSFPAAARRRALRALAREDVSLIEEDPAAALEPGAMTLRSGARLSIDAALIAAESQAPPWLAETGLALDEGGYVAVAPSLESLSHIGVFAAGDCAGVEGFARPKAGVFAVRQGGPLAANLRRAAQGAKPRPFRPQKRFLSLLSTADGRAIAVRAPFGAEGRWVWRWKDRIDRAFMAKHRPPPLPIEPSAAMRCAGCAAKVGPLTLNRALARIEATDHSAGATNAHDDAAVIDGGGATLRLETIDFFTAFWRDPWLLGRIAANHALSDVYAMGGRPETAQAVLALPPLGPRLAEEDLFQLLAGARSLLDREGVSLIGGHSSEGPALALGFAVSGAAPRDTLLRKGALRPGDKLILTRPIGGGLLFAAAMRRRARGEALFAALSRMQASHAAPVAALIAAGARATTDVTGFGLAGHLLEMLEAADLTAQLDLSAIPLLPQASALAEDGLASSLAPANLALAGAITGPDGAALSQATLHLLFDPQTAGPLLAAVPAPKAEAAIADLRRNGAPEAAIIGAVAERPSAGAPRVIVAAPHITA
ncbi:MAG: selenide, water dikinase SelD [Pseudomonadota bacterium]